MSLIRAIEYNMLLDTRYIGGELKQAKENAKFFLPLEIGALLLLAVSLIGIHN